MLKIDSHQHFWLYDPDMHAWINDSMHACRRNFLPADVQPILNKHGIDGCVAVQAEHTYIENDFLLGLAAANPFIKGVVGWVDLKSPDIDEQLERLSGTKLMKGFRHILQAEPDDRYMLSVGFMRGIGLLQQHGFSYDILIYPKHLKYAKDLVAAFPNQHFVIDHLAKPDIKAGDIREWQTAIVAIAAHENVYCKISGMVTEADWHNWKPDDFTPYLDVVFNAFGTKRVMFGSDWPVCNVAGGYEGIISAIEHYINTLSEPEQGLFWAKNAIDFYRLEV